MTYKEAGFTKFLNKQKFPNAIAETTESDASLTIPLVGGGAIAGGVTSSSTGRITINWDTGTILISDGAHNRVLIGEDGL